MSKRAYWRDIAFYGAIGGLTATQMYIASGDLPHALTAPVGILLATLVAIKAKLSNGKPEPPTVTGIEVSGK